MTIVNRPGCPLHGGDVCVHHLRRRSRWADAGVPLHVSTLAGQSRRLGRAGAVAAEYMRRAILADWRRLVAWLAKALP